MDYDVLTTDREVSSLARVMVTLPGPFFFDVETGYDGPKAIDRGAVDPRHAYVVGFSITDSKSWARYIPMRHFTGPNVPNALEIFKSILESRPIVAHNAGFEMRMLWRENIDLNVYSDTMLEAYCTGRYEQHGLKALVDEVLGHKMTEITSLWPGIKAREKKQIRFNTLDPRDPRVVEYACEDAAWCAALHDKHYPVVRDKDIFQLEMEVMPIVATMEHVGVGVDFGRARERADEIEIFLGEYESSIRSEFARLVGTDLEGLAEVAGAKPKNKSTPAQFNIRSAQQLSRVLFDHCGYTSNWTTTSGNPSTGDEGLKPLAKEVKAVAMLLDYRKVVKLHSSYYRKWIDDFSNGAEGVGRAHPGWKQNGVPAGRFAVGEPGVQQCPKFYRYEHDTRVIEGNFRDIIVAEQGYYFLDFDYKQLELRCIAGMAGETTLIDAFARGDDPYAFTASLLMNKPLEQVTKEERDTGKMFALALQYQMGKNSLAKRLGVKQNRANLLYRRFFENYPRMKDWIDEAKYQGTAKEHAVTHFGRIVPIFEFARAREREAQAEKASNGERGELLGKARSLYGHAERLCVNAPVQGTAADIAKKAMVNSEGLLVSEGLYPEHARIVINNHDELVFEIDERYSPQEMINLLRPAVEIDVPGFPPLETDWVYGYSWGSIQEAIVEEGDDA